MILPVSEGGGAAGHCPTLGPKVGFAGPPYKSAQPYKKCSGLREPVRTHDASVHHVPEHLSTMSPVHAAFAGPALQEVLRPTGVGQDP
jgi:hypothetical protein